MIGKLTNGIVKSLSQAFDGYSIYTEDVEQGLDPPCFLVLLNDSNFVRFRGDVFYLEADYTVHFFPGSPEPRRECGAVATDLQMALSTIALGRDELIDASEVQVNIDSDFMVVDVVYSRYLMLEQPPRDLVEGYTVNVMVKE